jgi:hypothetical protein
MALDLVAIREAMAAQIQLGVRREVNVFDGYIPVNPMPPCIVVKPAAVEYVTYEGRLSNPLCTVSFELWILLSTGLGSDGQRLLDEFISTGDGQSNSVRDALAADPTLGGNVDSLVVASADYLGWLPMPGTDSQTAFEWASLNVRCLCAG